ncbi:MAG: hypothetical protein DMG97_17040 [Acidobacteria bacterium]|nr:MAG: hypothetical protein DMG97_17040 [Acidobacteriota bacterium]
MYVVLGASGNTGHIVARNLLAQQKKVRVVGRNAAHLQPFTAQGAFIGDVPDASALTKALQQADSAYVMIPPNITTNDPQSYQEHVTDSIATAVKNSGVKNVVALSSIGADKPSGTGAVLSLHNFEQKLGQINTANVLFLRAAYFMENTLAQANIIRMMGSSAGPLRPGFFVFTSNCSPRRHGGTRIESFRIIERLSVCESTDIEALAHQSVSALVTRGLGT